MKYKSFLFVFLLGILVLIAGCSNKDNAITGNSVLDDSNKVMVYKGISCGCCSLYVNYFKNKFNSQVNSVDVQDITSLKDKYNIPYQLQSCHTTIIGNYFVEGHVPIEAVNKLLQEKPDILGIALPGMPSGSPGMPGSKEPFVIYKVNKDGSYDEFMRI